MLVIILRSQSLLYQPNSIPHIVLLIFKNKQLKAIFHYRTSGTTRFFII